MCCMALMQCCSGICIRHQCRPTDNWCDGRGSTCTQQNGELCCSGDCDWNQDRNDYACACSANGVDCSLELPHDCCSEFCSAYNHKCSAPCALNNATGCTLHSE